MFFLAAKPSSALTGWPRRAALGGVTLWSLFTSVACLQSGAQTAPDSLATATALIREGHYDAAIAGLDHARPAHGDDPRLPTVEGIAYSLKGDDAHALLCFRAALKIRPGFPGALQAEASILSRHRDPAAIPVLQQILAAAPQDTTAREMLALAEAQNGNCAAALRDFDAAAQAVPQHPESLQRKAACLLESRDFPAAVATFAQLHTLDPESTSAQYDLALAQLDAGDAHAAAATLTPLLDHTPDIDTLLLAADAFEQTGDTPRAATLLRQAIVADPSRSNSYVRFAELCMAHESYQTGVDMVTVGLAHQPAAASLFLARGLLYGGMADYDRAEADFKQAEALDPHHGTGAYGVGLVEAQRNKPEQALTTVRTALQAHPADAQLHLLLARLLLEAGARPGTPPFDEAFASASEAVRLNPALTAAHDLLARIYGDTGKPDLAAAQCRAALALDPEDGNALYRLMRALRATGDDKGAQAIARQVAAQHQQARESESGRLRYRIEEGAGTAGTPPASAGEVPSPQPAPRP